MKKLLLFSLVVTFFADIASCQGNYFRVTLKTSVEDAFSDSSVRLLAAAAARGDQVTIETLVRAGVDVNAVGKLGLTPLAWAVGAQSVKGAERLLQLGSQPNVEVEGQGTILAVAVGLKNLELFELLLRHHADGNWGSTKYRTAMGRAIIAGESSYLRSALESGADPNFNVEVNNFLDTATRIQDFEKTLILLKAGANPAPTPKMKAWIERSMSEAWLGFKEDKTYLECLRICRERGLIIETSGQ